VIVGLGQEKSLVYTAAFDERANFLNYWKQDE